MDSLRVARFPFLRDSAAFAEANDADLESLMTSPSYEDARRRGIKRIEDTIDNSEVGYTPLMNEYDRLMEVMSYPYARMIVSCVNDRFLTKRYALAESVRMNRLLGEEPSASAIDVSRELGVKATVDAEGDLRMHFGDYLRFSSRIKSTDWKLVNSELRSGYVHLPHEKFDRLLQNALQDRIESELPLNVPDEYAAILKPTVDHVSILLNEMKNRYSPTGGGAINLEFMPPCMRTILANAQNGMNLPHSARFALVSFLHTLGMDSEGILALFAQSPDFDESKSIYQIKHITGELSGTDGYTPPECSTMKTNGICFDPDALCNSEKMNHPLYYYRIKSGNLTPRDRDGQS
jgi:DNA primase large subunit